MCACIAAATLAFVAGCGGAGGDAGGGAGGGDGPPPAGSALRTAAPGEVLAHFKAQVQRRAGQGLDGTTGGTAVGTPLANAAAPGSSGTMVQEQGVDEDDRIKTDGAMLYALHAALPHDKDPKPQRLSAARIQPDGSLADVGTLPLRPDFTATGMFLAGEAGRLVVLSENGGYGVIQPAATQLVAIPHDRKLALDVYSAANGAQPAPLHRVEIDGWVVGTRRIGNVLYVVSSWMPDLAHYSVPANSSPAQVERSLAGLVAEELFPRIRVDGAAAQPLVGETDCWLQPANATLGLQLTTITAFDLGAPGLPRTSRCFVGDGNTLYMSQDNLYLATSQQVWIAAAFSTTVFPRETMTDIHKFGLRGMQIHYRGSGQVPGHLGWDMEKMPYRMSEYQGDLRVLSFTGETGWGGLPFAPAAQPGKPASPATLTVLRENLAQRKLETVSTLPNAQRPAPLGHEGEQVYAVHFAGPRAYVVTFRRTDPLYVLDLSSPADPKTAGELALPGFSEYLYPLASGKLLGVGRDATPAGVTTGLKVALFDVAVPAQPRLLGSVVLGAQGSRSALDSSRHGIHILAQGDKARIALPVLLTRSTGTSTHFTVQGLARFEADTAQGTLKERPFVEAVRFDGVVGDAALFARYDITQERAVQTASATYYLAGGQVMHIREP